MNLYNRLKILRTYLRDLEFISSGRTVIISSNGHKLVVVPPNLFIRSTTGFCHEDICSVKSARATHNCKPKINVLVHNFPGPFNPD